MRVWGGVVCAGARFVPSVPRGFWLRSPFARHPHPYSAGLVCLRSRHRGCAECQPRSLAPPAPLLVALGAVPSRRGGGAPPSAGCGGGTASRGDSSSGHGCRLRPALWQADGKENSGGFPSAVLSFGLSCQIIFLLVSVTVRGRARMSPAFRCF